MAESTVRQEDNMIKFDRGLFTVIFLNKHGLSRSEIEEIFFRFGPVESITETGTNGRGYRFVRFRERSWAVAAIAGLRNHPTVKLCAHQPKKSPGQRPAKKRGATGSDDDQCSVARSFSSSGSGESGRRRSEQESLPDLVCRLEASQRRQGDAARGVDATDLIVANIPHSSSAPYLLHIFHHLEPLAVSRVETTANRVRYCHVYFKSEQHAQQAEAIFDRHRLMDKNLIVMRSDRLVQSCLGRATETPKHT